MTLHRLSILLLLASSIAYAGTTGTIEGTVREKETRNPMPGVTVLIAGTKVGWVTDENGHFVFYNLDVGKYSLRFQMVGYAPLLYENIEVNVNSKTRVDVFLTPSAVQMNEMVIQAQRPLIQKDVLGTVHTVGGEDIKVLPVTTFSDVIGMKPGTTVEGNVRGGKTSEVLYLIDGLPAQDVLQGGLGADLPNSSIAQVALQTGGFEAEYGNAESGVVNVVTKTGSNTPVASLRFLKDNVGYGTANNKETETEFSASGPVVENSLFYFASLNYNENGTRWWQDFQKFFSMPYSRTVNGLAKLDYIISPSMRLSSQFLYSGKKEDQYDFSWRFDLSGLPPQQRDVYRIAEIFTHTLSEHTFYEIRLSDFHNRTLVGSENKPTFDPSQLYDYDFFLQYILQGKEQTWSNTLQDIYTAKGDFTSEIADGNILKAGGELNFYKVQTDLEKYEPRTTYFGKPILTEDPLNFSTQYRFFPKSGSMYVQDKYTVENATVSAGVRYDFLNPTASRPAFEFVPVQANEYRLQLNHYVPATLKYQFSPRFGFSVPYSDKGFLFVNYGYYFQYPLFDYLYSGLDAVSIQKGVSAVVGNPDLDPERTKSWEISVKQVVVENVVASVTYFKKESRNLIDSKTFLPTDSKYAGDYGFAQYVNNSYADVDGAEIVVSRDRGELLTGDISYSYMTAQGISDNANEGLNLLQWGFAPILAPYYLSWDQRHTLKVDAAIHLPEEIVCRTFFQFHTGRPYTYYPTKDGFTPLDSTLAFIPNNARMPSYSSLDIKISKPIHLNYARFLDLVLFIDARNVLNSKNVRWMDSSGRIGGELGDPGAYYVGRRIRGGVTAEVGF
ncbi:MAG TPA: TonB-dependent receptor [Bacteroidota bacterium]|nr:TonB-dependent receptor [Bacteroidota bacterium]